MTNDNNDGNKDIKLDTRNNNNNCSSVNVNDVVVEVVMPPPELQPSQKKRKNMSMVWDHFTKGYGYSDDDSHVKCHYCDAMYACHPRRNGNSTMRTHLEHYCKKNLFQLKDNKVDLTQTKLSF